MSSAYGISQPVRRREDVRFLTGGGRYAGDLNLHGQLYASFVRSSITHGAILAIEAEDARRVPGVVAVFTGGDLLAAGLKEPWLAL